MNKTCKTCKHSQDGFFNPALLFCGAKGTQVVEVKPDGCCDWWEEKEEEKE